MTSAGLAAPEFAPYDFRIFQQLQPFHRARTFLEGPNTADIA
jgi:hypothetical protein